MKVFPAHPGVKPIIDMYCDSFTKLSMPWKTPRPVAEVRLDLLESVDRRRILFSAAG